MKRLFDPEWWAGLFGKTAPSNVETYPKTPKTRKRLTPLEEAGLIFDVLSGMDAVDAARKYGISRTCVYMKTKDARDNAKAAKLAQEGA